MGSATAEVARAKGYETKSADGDASDLVRLILAQKPCGRMLHPRGETSRGDITEHLTDAGLDSAEVVTYRKVRHDLRPDVRRLIESSRPVLVPLFSAETVSILASWDMTLKNALCIAISRDVGRISEELLGASTVVSGGPNLDAMVQATAALIA